MFGKNDFVDDLSRDLCRARDKRDALASHVTTLTAQITELEARLSAENDRRLNPRGQSCRRLPTSITRSCWLLLKSPTQSMPCWAIWTDG